MFPNTQSVNPLVPHIYRLNYIQLIYFVSSFKENHFLCANPKAVDLSEIGPLPSTLSDIVLHSLINVK